MSFIQDLSQTLYQTFFSPSAKKEDFTLPKIHKIKPIIGDKLYQTDVVVLGGGVGGLTAASYLGRAGFSPIVVEKGVFGGAITQSKEVENFPGFEKISGLALADKLKHQAEKNGASLLSAELVHADFSGPFFTFKLNDPTSITGKARILARSCIIALGSTANSLNVPGESTYWSKGVHNCAVCDGAFYKDKVVAVVGGGDGAILEAEYLSRVAKKVYLLVRKYEFKGVEKKRMEEVIKRANVEVLYGVHVNKIEGDENYVQKVELYDPLTNKTASLPIDGLFLAIGSSPNTQLFKEQIRLDSNQYIESDKECSTSIPGVFAIGDIANPRSKQAATAGGDAARAAMRIQDYLAEFPSKVTPILPKKENTQAKVLEITSTSHLKEILSSSAVPVLVDFYASWCFPCQILSPKLQEWAEENKEIATVCKVNIDLVTELAKTYQITNLPTVIAFDPTTGLPIKDKKAVGLPPIESLLSSIKKE